MKDFSDYITDEMLAAYIDGNSLPIENDMIEKCLSNCEIQELLDIVHDFNSNPEFTERVECLEFELPKQIFEQPYSIWDEVHEEMKKTNSRNIM